MCHSCKQHGLTAQNSELELQYKSCYARILDAKRRFLEAATRYYDLSQSSSGAADAPKVNRPSRCVYSTAMIVTQAHQLAEAVYSLLCV